MTDLQTSSLVSLRKKRSTHFFQINDFFLKGIQLLVFCIILLPVLSLFFLASQGPLEDWFHLSSSVLPTALKNTLLLLVLVAVMTAFIGIASAWILVSFDFPFRRSLSWLIILPLATPPYLAAYALFEFFNYTGPVQSLLRYFCEFQTIRDYWFPDLRSTVGTALVLSSVLYPYVYLTTRLVFRMQGRKMADAAQTLGATPVLVFFRILLPLARPAIITGIALVLMETLNDIGATEYLGTHTLTFSVYTTWLNRGNLGGAAQLSLVVLFLVLFILSVENRTLSNRRFHVLHTTHLKTHSYRQKISGFRGFCLVLLLSLPVITGFGIPFLVFSLHAIERAHTAIPESLSSAFLNSVLVAGLTAFFTVLIALLLANINRFSRLSTFQPGSQIAMIGYALPAGILALGLLSILTCIDSLTDQIMIALFDKQTGLFLTGSFFAIVLACTIRFIAVAQGPIRSGLSKLPPSLHDAARTLGRTRLESNLHILFPLLLPAIFSAAMLVFVDTIKELSSTILLRPMGFDTLATYIYERASRGAPEEGALAALLIMTSSLLPMFFLSKTLFDDIDSTKIHEKSQ